MGKNQASDEPLSLVVGTEVSAKYKGAFCEAKVSKVSRLVRCKVTYRFGSGPSTILDDQIMKGNIQIGSTVQVKLPDKKDFVEATILKLQDCSQYTVVFDDGDIATLRRSALCLKSGRHYSESESLDQLPLTHPEHFGIAANSRRGRRNQQNKDENSDDELDDEIDSDLMTLTEVIGRVIWVEGTDKKKTKDNWFPCVIVSPNAQPASKINLKEECLVRSFKDGRFYTVPRQEVTDFTKDSISKYGGSNEATERALQFLESDEIPALWDRNVLFSIRSSDFDSDDNLSEVDDQEQNEHKDHFVAQLYKFLDDRGTSINKTPSVSNKDVDLYRLFQLVLKLGGYNRVAAKAKWPLITNRLNFPVTSKSIQGIKQVYKDWLFAYEDFYRKLGCTMTDTPKILAKKTFSRSLLREKDRITPVNSPKLSENSADELMSDKRDDSDDSKSRVGRKPKPKSKLIETTHCLNKQSNPSSQIGKTSEHDMNTQDDRASTSTNTNVNDIVKTEDNSEENMSSSSDTDNQQSEPKKLVSKKSTKNKVVDEKTAKSIKSANNDDESLPKIESEKRRGRKKKQVTLNKLKATHSIGDEVLVDCRDGKQKGFYAAKIMKIDVDEPKGNIYYVHYPGWNIRYDRWINPDKIVTKKSPPSSRSSTSSNATVSAISTTTTSSLTTTTTTTTTPSSITITLDKLKKIRNTRSSSPASVSSTGSPTASSVLKTKKGVRKVGRKLTKFGAQNQSESDSEPTSNLIKNKVSETMTKIRTYQRKNKKQDIADKIIDKKDNVDKPKKAKLKKTIPKPEESHDDDTLDTCKEMPQLKSVKNETDDQNDELCLETKDGVAIQEEKIETKDDNPDVKDNDVYAFKETDSQDLSPKSYGDDKSSKNDTEIPLEDVQDESKLDVQLPKSEFENDQQSEFKMELETDPDADLDADLDADPDVDPDTKPDFESESNVQTESQKSSSPILTSDDIQTSDFKPLMNPMLSIKVIEGRIPIVDLAIENEIKEDRNLALCSKSSPVDDGVKKEDVEKSSEHEHELELESESEISDSISEKKEVKRYSRKILSREFIESDTSSSSSSNDHDLRLEKDSNLSNLLCEETFPGSPPPTMSNQMMTDNEYSSKAFKWQTEQIHYGEEMPFACTAGTSVEVSFNMNVSPKSELQGPNPVTKETIQGRKKSPCSSPEAATMSSLIFQNSDGNYLANKLELQKLASADNETRQKLIQITKTKLLDEDVDSSPTNVLQKKPNQNSSNENNDLNCFTHQRKRKISHKDKDANSGVKRCKRTEEELFDRNKNYLLNKFYKPPRKLLYEDIDPSWNSEQRIEFIRSKMADIREFYQDVKTELTSLERKKKKFRRREKAAKAKSQNVGNVSNVDV